jgi:hypothetical protein
MWWTTAFAFKSPEALQPKKRLHTSPRPALSARLQIDQSPSTSLLAKTPKQGGKRKLNVADLAAKLSDKSHTW